MTRKELINTLLQQVEAKFNRGSSTNWKNRDFEDLNFEIYKKTKTSISALTLKRIFGIIKTAEEYHPQKATINALIKYCDYTPNQLSMVEKAETDASPILKTVPPKSAQSFYFFRNKSIFYSVAALLLILLGSFYLLYKKSHSGDIEVEANFKIIKTDGENPKTVYFECNTPQSRDSFYISYDRNYKPIYIPNGKQKKSSYFFQYPGLYHVQLLRNWNKVCDSIAVFLPTNGWQMLGYYFDQKYNERYFPIEIGRSMKDGYLHPTKEVLNNAGMDTSKMVVVRIDNFKHSGVNGDNFVLTTTLKNSDNWSGIRCNSIFLYVEGKNGTIRLRFANPGCSYWIDYQLSEKEISHKDEEMSSFTFNLSEWQRFKLENRNKKVVLSINDVQRFTKRYEKSIGEIVGVTVLFHGNGYMKAYELTDTKGHTIFKF